MQQDIKNEVSKDAHANYCRQSTKYKNFAAKLEEAILVQGFLNLVADMNFKYTVTNPSFDLLQGKI